MTKQNPKYFGWKPDHLNVFWLKMKIIPLQIHVALDYVMVNKIGP